MYLETAGTTAFSTSNRVMVIVLLSRSVDSGFSVNTRGREDCYWTETAGCSGPEVPVNKIPIFSYSVIEVLVFVLKLLQPSILCWYMFWSFRSVLLSLYVVVSYNITVWKVNSVGWYHQSEILSFKDPQLQTLHTHTLAETCLSNWKTDVLFRSPNPEPMSKALVSSNKQFTDIETEGWVFLYSRLPSPCWFLLK